MFPVSAQQNAVHKVGTDQWRVSEWLSLLTTQYLLSTCQMLWCSSQQQDMRPVLENYIVRNGKDSYTTKYNIKQNKIKWHDRCTSKPHAARARIGTFMQLEWIREGIPGEQTMCWALEGRKDFGRPERGRGGRLSRLRSFVSLGVRCILGTCGLQ